MIPKIIHYCWFGQHPLPASAQKCIESWKKYCPDFEIIEHNEFNYDISKYVYMQEAYAAKKWAFVSDVARLDILYNYGGIYLDVDVELLCPINHLLTGQGFMGFEDMKQVASGLGIASVPHSDIIKLLLSDYENLHFINKNGDMDLTPCPVRNTKKLLEIGLIPDGSKQCIQEFTFYPRTVLAPLEYTSGKLKFKTKDTVSIHHYAASWETADFHRRKKINYIFGTRIGGVLNKAIDFTKSLGG